MRVVNAEEVKVGDTIILRVPTWVRVTSVEKDRVGNIRLGYTVVGVRADIDEVLMSPQMTVTRSGVSPSERSG